MRRKNPLLFPLVFVSMAAIMYCIAFHDMRDNYNDMVLKYESHQMENTTGDARFSPKHFKY